MRFETAVIDDIRRETADSLVITLRGADALAGDFRSGQHLTVKADIGGEAIYRAYSICQPAFRRRLQIGARLAAGGVMSAYLARRQKGEPLMVARPHGAFYLRAPAAAGENVLFIAGGSGITPVIGMLEALLHSRAQSRATLLYVNRALSSTMFLERLMQMKNRFMSRLETHLFFTREAPAVEWRARRLNADALADLSRRGVLNGDNFDACYLCGPAAMMESCRAFLRGHIAGVYSEAFDSAHPPPAAPAPRRAAGAAAAARVRIVMDGARREFDFCAGDASVLDAARRQNIMLPFACAGGVCGTCRAKVLQGAADMAKNYALEADDLNNGFVLSCQAKPRGDMLSLSFDY